jgi:hypothetical protein
VKATPRDIQSQPVVIEDPQQSQRLSPCRALIKSRLANETFESQLRSAATEAAIVEDGAEDDGFDAHLKDNFDDIKWSPLSGYIKPLASSRTRSSRSTYSLSQFQALSVSVCSVSLATSSSRIAVLQNRNFWRLCGA